MLQPNAMLELASQEKPTFVINKLLMQLAVNRAPALRRISVPLHALPQAPIRSWPPRQDQLIVLI
jgi:hypothetical protein